MRKSLTESQKKILNEVLQILVQFRAEFPGSRRAYPKIIKEHIVALARSGLKGLQISELVEISYYTVNDWIPVELRRRRNQNSKFVQLSLPPKPTENKAELEPLQNSSLTVTVKDKILTSMVTVITPTSFKVEFLRM